MIIKLIIFVAITSFLSLISKGQNPFAVIADNVGLISYVTLDSLKTEYTGTGTILVKGNESDPRFFLVTNKHVLPGKKECNSINFRIKHKFKDIDSFLSIPVGIYTDGSINTNVKFDPKGEDVAIVELTKYYKENKGMNDHMFIPYDLLATTDTLRKLQTYLGDEIFFIGYPSFFYNKNNIEPILRTGVIASNPLADFYFSKELRNTHYARFHQKLPEKFNGFLIDANVYGGSSGSLVIEKPGPKLEGEFLSFNFIPKIIILGIATTSYFDLDPRSTGGTRLNLGGVIRCEAIKRTIDLF